MKKFLKSLKIIGLGFLELCEGVTASSGIWLSINLIKNINSETGWMVVLDFLLMILTIVSSSLFIYDLGTRYYDSIEWTAYKRKNPGYNNTGDEIANEVADKDN